MLTGTSRPYSVYQFDQSVVIVFVPSRVWRWGNVSKSVVHHVLFWFWWTLRSWIGTYSRLFQFASAFSIAQASTWMCFARQTTYAVLLIFLGPACPLRRFGYIALDYAMPLILLWGQVRISNDKEKNLNLNPLACTGSWGDLTIHPRVQDGYPVWVAKGALGGNRFYLTKFRVFVGINGADSSLC